MSPDAADLPGIPPDELPPQRLDVWRAFLGAHAAVTAPDREDADKLLDAGRRPEEMLAFFGIGPGMRVAELCAGRGYTSELLARVTGDHGKVFAENPQNYDIPDTADLKKYQAVTIWCARFNVNFGTAPLAGTMPSGPKALAHGQFKGYAHETEGNAAIFDVQGNRVLRLTNFKTSNGPDVHVYLVAAPDAQDNDTVKKSGFVDLGSMKGNVGDQNYDVPNDVDLHKYQAVTIWCAR